ncbi:MAG: hypothetical protein JWO36_1347 [Myxococcales bacterium]|nr:hypothetical protein [Myxococcales bacterium]
MGRVLLAGAMVIASIGVAAAGPTRKVRIETDPPGATVYLNDPESGAVCDATPCTIDAPIGVTPIIVQLKNYGPIVDQIDVPKRGPAPTVKFTLSMALATLVFEAPAAKGASIRVDEEDKGKVPARIEVSGNDAHHVVVTMGGKTLYDDYVNVGVGEELAIATKPGGAVVATKDPDPVVTDDPGGGGGSDDGVEKQAVPEAPRNRFINLAAVIDIGFRNFTYDKGANPTTNVRDESEVGQLMGGLELELWPLANAGHLRGLSVFARYEHGVTAQPVMNANGLKTMWDTLEATVRHRWNAGDTLAFDAGAGFVRDSYGFSGDAAAVALTPDATYNSIRIGGRVALRAGGFEPYLAAENRIVLSGGTLSSRFRSPSASGYRAAIGVAANHGALTAKLEASLIRYSWQFSPEVTDTYRADGATDAVEVITASVGFVR